MKPNPNELHDRINRVINTPAFEQKLKDGGVDLFDFQCDWHELSKGDFNKLPKAYQDAIAAGEEELSRHGEVTLA